jgi:LacI family repressor for deo operon, udp, cdd, tsx, nupC, and nupG
MATRSMRPESLSIPRWSGAAATPSSEGARATQRFLALTRAERPTAIFAASDEMAIGCVSALRENGIAVPEAVSVAGFDGIDYSAMYEPPLTTMLQPRSELGRLAAEELVRQLSGQPAQRGRVRLPCKLVVRQSVAPAGREASPLRQASARDETAASR